MDSLNGLLLINKPVGCTSHDVVARVRRILKIRGVGHAGTLDPLASGLLVILVGEGTKVSDYILNGHKTYEVEVRLGVQTDTQDLDGQVLKQVPVDFSGEKGRQNLRDAVMSLSGNLELQVPLYSAVKKEGQKLYDYARKGQDVVVPVRTMGFYNLEILTMAADSVRVKMYCSKGSFVRAWAEALGQKLGCGGAVAALKRVASEPYELELALTLDELEQRWGHLAEQKALGGAWVPLRESLPSFRIAWVEGQDERLLRNGQISHSLQAQLLKFVDVSGAATPGVRVLSRGSQALVAILLAAPGEFYKIKRVFQNA
jgi:tRNA pseudouridine55 synthase